MNYYIFFIAIVVSIIENRHFGWNAFPKSDNEMICDILIAIIFAMAFLGGNKCHSK